MKDAITASEGMNDANAIPNAKKRIEAMTRQEGVSLLSKDMLDMVLQLQAMTHMTRG